MGRLLLKSLSAAVISLGLLLSQPVISPSIQTVAYAQEESRWGYSKRGWYYTREEAKRVYEKEYEEGERLNNYIKFENGEYIGSKFGKTFEVSENFIKQTLKQLEETLEKGYAEHIFRLDCFHSHLFVPEESFDKYKDLDHVESAKVYVYDTQLGALYHNAEHLTAVDKEGNIDPIAKDLISKRSVLGWYDGRPLEQTHPTEDMPLAIREANSASIPDGYHTIGSLTFKATKNGEFSIFHKGKEIRVDISFDGDDYY
ncbi:hypothetical protein FJZ53_01290 [Candidatus Woesearchaeota archaeon]|nr:hypothetical protein [Candidatus Woesearchaeota archaeon]